MILMGDGLKSTIINCSAVNNQLSGSRSFRGGHLSIRKKYAISRIAKQIAEIKKKPDLLVRSIYFRCKQ